MQSKLAGAGHIDRRINVLATRPEKGSNSAADFGSFRRLTQFEAGFRQNVWESGVLKGSRESHEFWLGGHGVSASTRVIPEMHHASCRDLYITVQRGLGDL
jgi:hypothetical protein